MHEIRLHLSGCPCKVFWNLLFNKHSRIIHQGGHRTGHRANSHLMNEHLWVFCSSILLQEQITFWGTFHPIFTFIWLQRDRTLIKYKSFSKSSFFFQIWYACITKQNLVSTVIKFPVAPMKSTWVETSDITASCTTELPHAAPASPSETGKKLGNSPNGHNHRAQRGKESRSHRASESRLHLVAWKSYTG